MAQRIIGLDIGSHSVKAVVLESSLRRLSLAAMREHHLPTDATGAALPGELSAAIKAVMGGIDADVLVAGVPGVQVLLRELDLPFSDDKNVAQVLPFRLEGVLPRPVDTVVHDWHMLRKTATGAQFLCPAADRQWLEQWLGEVRRGGVEPRQVTLSMLAMENLKDQLELGQGERVAFIDLGHRSTQVTVVRDGQIEGVRAISRGGHQVTVAIARALSIPYADAEQLKHRLDLDAPDNDADATVIQRAVDADATVIQRAMDDDGPDLATHARVQQAAMQALEPLLRELKVTLDALSGAGQDLDRVVLIGGTAKMRGIEALLEETLGFSVERPQPRGALWGSEAANERLREVGLPAMALALEQVVDSRGHRVNLRRGDLGGVSDFSAVTAKAGWIAAFLAVLLVIFFVRKLVWISTLETHERELATALDEEGEKLFGDKYEVDGEIATIDRFRNMRDSVGDGGKADSEPIYPQMTAFRIFYDVTRVQREVNLAAEPQKPEPEEPMDDEEEGMPKPQAPKPAETPSLPAAEKHQIELTLFAAEVKSPTAAAATIGGSGFDIVTIENFVTKLRAHPCFKQVDRQETKKTTNPARPGWTDFTIKVDVACGTPTEPKTAKSDAPDKTKPADKSEEK